jgi:HSP20 family protein
MATTTEKTTPAKTVETQRAITPFEDLERWFDENFPTAWLHRRGWPSWGELTLPAERLSPRVDVVERDDEILLHAEIPGVTKENLEVSVTEDTVTLKGSSERENRKEEGEYYRCEIARGNFSRTVRLPSDVDTEKVKASFEDGMLQLKMPKVTKAKRRTVELG